MGGEVSRVHRHKFNAKPGEADGIHFSSTLERDYYLRLKLRVKSGEVLFFLRQTPLHLPGDVKLVVDFLEFHADGTVHFIDTKGVETESFLAKKRIAEAIYPIEIEIVKKNHRSKK